MSSIHKLNNVGDSAQPCLNPIFESNSSDTVLPSILIVIFTFLYIALNPSINYVDIPFLLNFHHNASLITAPKAFCKSTKIQYIFPLFLARYLSSIVLKMNILSVVLPF
jgi:hypothetical protein